VDCIQLYCEAGGPSPPPPEPDATLIHDQEDATLQVLYRDELRGVCDVGFNQYDAQVACQQLYGSPIVLQYATGVTCGEDNYWISQLDCTGAENSIFECYHEAFGQHQCSANVQCVQLYCYGGGPQPPVTPDPIPDEPEEQPKRCIEVYTQCGFAGEMFELCDDRLTAALESEMEVLCLRVPKDTVVRLYQPGENGTDTTTVIGEISEDVACFDEPVNLNFLQVTQSQKSHKNQYGKKSNLRKNVQRK